MTAVSSITVGALVLALSSMIACSDAAGPTVPTEIVASGRLTRSVVAEGNLKAVSATTISPPRSRQRRPMVIAWLATDGSKVKKGDLVARFDPTDLESQLEDGETAMALASAQLRKEQIAARTARARRDSSATLAKLELDRTKRFRERDTEIYSRNQIIEAEVNEVLSEARREHAEAAKQIEKGLSRSKADLAVVAQRRAKIDIDSASSGLEGLEIRAPHDGLLVLKRNWRGERIRTGDSVWPGQTLAEIPELSAMEAEVFVLEVDGGGLEKDTPVLLTIDARADQQVKGVISRVDDLAKERIRDLPVQYFAAVVTLEETDPTIMKPGQRVTARIQLADEEGLVVPRHAIFVVDGEDVVFKKVASGFEPSKVTLGQATTARVIITEGLEAGDEIALTDPRVTDAKKEGSGSAEGTAGP